MKLKTKFQDKDFDFGEIVKAKVTTYYDENKVVVMADIARGGISRFEYNSIKDFTDHWEDAPEEPKKYYYLDYGGRIKAMNDANDEEDMARKAIGNYFETKEETERAVDKLKAFTRLEDKGFRFRGWLFSPDGYHPPQERIRDGVILFKVKNDEEVRGLLDTVFGGEE